MDTKLYDALEVAPTASPEVVEAAYKALMKVHHPDKKGTAGAVARRLTEAYEVLSNPVKRAAYDAQRMNLGGKIIGEQWLVEAPIAEGGFGKTYRGSHVLTGGAVCIKHCSRISPADADILIGEAKAMWDLRHFAIPAVRNLLKLDDGSLALVISYVPGPTLQEVVEGYAAKRKRLDPEDVAWMTERILNALSYMHRHGVVHGDIKPANVIVQADTHMVVLVDFGLAAVKPTRMTASKGYTDLFSPPEQVKGSPLIPQLDFYALGMTMIYALSGGDFARVAAKEIPHDVPEPMAKFIRRLIVRDPLFRPDWATEDITETVHQMRQEAFGRQRSGMKTLDI